MRCSCAVRLACPHCGAEVTHLGELLPRDGGFVAALRCTLCGAPFEKDAEFTTAPA